MDNRTYIPRISEPAVEIGVPSIEIDVSNDENGDIPEMDVEPEADETHEASSALSGAPFLADHHGDWGDDPAKFFPGISR